MYTPTPTRSTHIRQLGLWLLVAPTVLYMWICIYAYIYIYIYICAHTHIYNNPHTVVRALVSSSSNYITYIYVYICVRVLSKHQHPPTAHTYGSEVSGY